MSEDFTALGIGLRKIRRRRWVLWSVTLLYLPEMWITLKLTHSRFALGVVFAIWVAFLCYAVIPVAFSLCPRCGNYFHMKGLMPLYLRRCLHCGLHVCADKKADYGKS